MEIRGVDGGQNPPLLRKYKRSSCQGGQIDTLSAADGRKWISGKQVPRLAIAGVGDSSEVSRRTSGVVATAPPSAGLTIPTRYDLRPTRWSSENNCAFQLDFKEKF